MVTSKIYRLKQHFLPPAMAWRLTKIKKCTSWDLIHFSQGMNEYMEKYWTIHSFSFYGPCILERELWRQSKIIGIKRFKLLCKLTMANLCKIGLKVREWHFRELSSRTMSLTLLPPPGNYTSLAHIYGLTGHEWSLTLWAEIRDNTVIESQGAWLENGSQAKFRCLF